MFDMTQMFHQRRMVKRGDEFWLVCYVVATLDPPGPKPGREASTVEQLAWGASSPHLALAVRCDARGTIQLPAPAHLIRFVDADMVNPEADDAGGEAVVP